MKRLIGGMLVLLVGMTVLSSPAGGQSKGKDFFDTAAYPNATPISGGIIIWRNTSATNTATFGGLMGAGLDITGNPVRIVGSGKNTILASSAATSDKTMTFPNVTGNVVSTGDTGTVTTTMLAGPVARTRLTANVTNATTTFANLTDLTTPTLAASGKYVGQLVIKCNNSQSAEGIKIDFAGGSASATAFWAAGNQTIGGTVVVGSGISTSLAGVLNFSTITGETLLVFNVSIVVNGAGTIIPRFAENSTTSGTLTAELGSYFILEPSSN